MTFVFIAIPWAAQMSPVGRRSIALTMRRGVRFERSEPVQTAPFDVNHHPSAQVMT